MPRANRVAASVAAWILACSVLTPTSAHAQSGAANPSAYPERAIHTIVGFAAGSGADTLARFFSRKLGERAGRPIIVDNKPGATANIALGLAANAKPDGYTVIYASNSNMAGNKFLFKDLPFDTERDFIPLALLSQTTFITVVAPDTKIASIADLTQHLKASPRAKYANTNQTAHLATEFYKTAADVAAVSVPYRTAGDALADILNGTLDFMIIDGTFGLGQIKSGRIKPLAVTTAERLAELPQVPTMTEAGIPDYEFSSWWAAWVPKNTPPAIVAKLEAWYTDLAADPETRAFLSPIGGTPLKGGSTATAAKLKTEIEKWGRVTKAAGLTPQ